MNKEKRQLLNKTFQLFMEVGLGGVNLELLDDIVAMDVVGFGTTIDEKIFGIKELQELLVRQKEQSAGMDVSWKINTLDIHISSDENTSIFTNDLIFYITVDDNTIEMYLRFSVVLEYVQNKWLVVHWHGSKPENVESEKDTWGIENWKTKAEALEKEVAARTADLVEKNRELKIEAALEKVRARSSAMQNANELGDVISIIFQKLDEFDISVKDGVALITFNEGSKDLNEWMANPGFGAAMNFHLPYFDHPVLSNLWEAKNSGEEILIHRYSAEESRSFLNHIFEHSDFKHTPLPVKDYCLSAETYATNIAFQKHTAIFINDYSGLSLASLEIDLLKRFSLVFEQTYVRFLDLQKAEAQAREAQIQLAMERVRARTMAMQKSDELAEAASVMFQQLTDLGIKNTASGFALLDPNDKTGDTYTAANGAVLPYKITMRYDLSPSLNKAYDAWKNGKEFLMNDISGKELEENNRAIAIYMQQTYDPEMFSKIMDFSESNIQPEVRDRMVAHHAYFSQGMIVIGYHKPIEEVDVLIRFAKVFEQTYTRFLDLQKAEAQAKEAQIEVAIERVRAQSMAMHQPDDLDKVNKEILKQLQWLQVKGLTGVSIWLMDENGWVNAWDLSSPGNMGDPNSYSVQYDAKKYDILGEPWRIIQNSDQSYFVLDYPTDRLGRAIKEWEDVDPVIANGFRQALAKGKLTHQWNAFARLSNGLLSIDLVNPPFEDTKTILLKMAGAFNLAYQRFLDLQKAEAQAREAQIEAAMERIRSKSLAMYKTDDLRDVVVVLFEQMQGLSVDMGFASVSIFIFEDGSKNINQWLPLQNGVASLKVPYFEHPISSDLVEARESGVDYFAKVYTFEEKNAWLEKGFLLTDYKDLPEEFKTSLLEAPGYAISISLAKNSGICIPSFVGKFPSDEDVKIMKRVGKVFEQAYIRFLDLQKAETQAREAQIEAALERTRTQSMLMLHSNELKEISKTFHEQLLLLGIDSEFSFVWLPEEEKQQHMFWATWVSNVNGIAQFQNKAINYPLDKTEPGTAACYVAWESGQPVHETFVPPGEIGSFFASWEELLCGADQLKPELFPDGIYYTEAYMKYGCFGIDIRRKLANDEKEILRRFSVEFERTYTRFLDLQKAEAQVRESQIEAALERVRSRSMAMHRSEELAEVASVLYQELVKLGITDFVNCGFVEMDEKNNSQKGWNTNPDGSPLEGYFLPLSGEDVLDERYKAWKEQVPLFLQRVGEERLRKHMEFAIPTLGSKQVEEMVKANFPDPTYFYCCNFKYGYLSIIAGKTYSLEDEALMIRFTNAFAQTYTRFLDLQKAEAQAREATKQASLDRVRGEISSMRSANDLDRITPLVFNELTTLGIPFIRCGVFIVNEKRNNVEIYLSTPEGKSLAVMTLPFDANEMTTQSVKAWKKEEVYVQHWNQTDFINWSKSLAEQGYVKDLKTYQGTAVAPENLYLHFVPFAQGLLYVGSTQNLSEEQIDLVKALARSFAIAYARYEDFVKLEQAKVEVETAMIHLKATQSQLVQQEKLASLGQLTAGIAHEIKNPLNFVNNFSEVSIELIEEALEEIVKTQHAASPIDQNNGLDEIIAILDDVQSNLSKIHEHGTRANGIVTSMLQHSRGGSGKMEPTNLNALIREYVNLSYHGMRAGNYPIDVQITLDLDPEIQEVPLIKEDFTRVVINLCNNAFDAMKSAVKPQNFAAQRAASLWVQTKKYENLILIKVEDNGSGIPDEIKDKILQPFFTTKKGTEGTGLGLSITHDIVKAHGGELKVESEEGKGSKFIINIPIS